MRALAFLSILALLNTSCGKDTLETDLENIQEYLDENGLMAESTDSGLHYIIEEEGEGSEFPSANSDVTLFYAGYLLDGTPFDATGPNPTTFNLSQVIPGFREGIRLFKKGGEGTIIIPSQLGYGSQQAGIIPPNSVLVFDVEIVDF